MELNQDVFFMVFFRNFSLCRHSGDALLSSIWGAESIWREVEPTAIEGNIPKRSYIDDDNLC